MTAVTATKAREHIYQLIQDVNTNSAPVIITNKKGNLQSKPPRLQRI